MTEGHPLDWYPEPDDGDPVSDSLALIERARAALASAETLADIGAVMEIAERGRRYAKAAQLGLDAENVAAALRLEAEREAGKWLAERRKFPSGRRPAIASEFPTQLPPSLRELAVTRQQSSDWQLLARLPEGTFREHVARARTTRRPLTTAGLVQLARRTLPRPRPTPPDRGTPPSASPALLGVGEASRLPLADASVHLIVTSPPYSVGIAYEQGGDVAAAEWPRFMEEWLREARRVTTPGGRLALNVPLDTVSGGFRPTYVHAVEAALAAGWAYRSTVVWADGELGKSVARGSVDSAASPYVYTGAEMVPLFSNGAWRREPPCPSDIDHADWIAWTNGLWRFHGEQTPWEGHPAPFPVELPRRLIALLSFPGDAVLDPFLGSGTTLMAAVERGRQAIGFDISVAYVESARRRLEAYACRASMGRG
ncbi:MAG: DNA-methyltransferase [Chloroflexota bacterium]